MNKTRPAPHFSLLPKNPLFYHYPLKYYKIVFIHHYPVFVHPATIAPHFSPKSKENCIAEINLTYTFYLKARNLFDSKLPSSITALLKSNLLLIKISKTNPPKKSTLYFPLDLESTSLKKLLKKKTKNLKSHPLYSFSRSAHLLFLEHPLDLINPLSKNGFYCFLLL